MTLPVPISIANEPATGVASNLATLNASLGLSLGCVGTNATVLAYGGTANGGTNSAAWASSVYVGKWANIVSMNIANTVTGLAPNTTYYFTFLATNAVDTLWATNLQSFATFAVPPTPGLPLNGVKVTNSVPSFSFAAAKGCMYRLDYKNALTDAARVRVPGRGRVRHQQGPGRPVQDGG